MGFELGPRAAAARYRLAAFDTIGSTSAEAMQRARAGEAGRLWVVATEQTAGHGRRGRPWATPAGNLAASLLLPAPAQSRAATLGFVAGLALEAAIREVRLNPLPLRERVPLSLAKGAGEGLSQSASTRPLTRPSADAEGHPLPQGERGRAAPMQLKWPNDLLIDGAKVAGILLEAANLPGGEAPVVIGIGVNVRHAPRDLPYPAISLTECGIDVSPKALFQALAEAWVEQESIWNGGRGFAVIRERWLERAVGLGAPIAVRAEGSVVRGIFETIDDEGRLIVRLPGGGARSITAGEVHFGAAATAVA